MKKIIVIVFFFCAVIANSQSKKINNYQYIIVQNKFDFLREPDQYKTSSLTKFLLEKSGFTVFLSDETLPDEITKNRCLSLFASVKDESSMFKTKSRIELKDCYGNVLYISEQGASKLKEYQQSYQEAIRNAYETMEDITYSNPPELKEIVSNSVMITNSVINQNKIDSNTDALKILYAQATKNGFQLVNTVPEVVFILFKTAVDDVFIVKDINGILYKKNDKWVLEYYKNNELISETYQIKF